MVAQAETKTFQGTIHGQVTVPGATEWEAENKIRDLKSYLTDNGIVVDQWTVPLMRNLTDETPSPTEHVVLMRVVVESPYRSEASCAASEIASYATEASDTERELRNAESNVESATENVAYGERRLSAENQRLEDYKKAQAVAVAAFDTVKERHGTHMNQGRIVSYEAVVVAPVTPVEQS